MIFALTVMLLSIQACNANFAGTEQPVTIDGIRIQITGVGSKPVFELDDQNDISERNDLFYLCVFAIASGDSVNQLERISEWEVTLSDDKGGVYNLQNLRIEYDSDRLSGTVFWDFVVRDEAAEITPDAKRVVHHLVTKADIEEVSHHPRPDLPHLQRMPWTRDLSFALNLPNARPMKLDSLRE
jgi:hypothetical protein